MIKRLNNRILFNYNNRIRHYNVEGRKETGIIIRLCEYETRFFSLLKFSLKDMIDNSSTSSDERNKEQPPELHPKVNRLIDNDSSWYR